MPSSPANLATQADDAATTLWHDDALGRRISDNRSIAGAGGTQSADLYYTPSWQVVEERQGSTVMHQYVWSLAYIDALVLRDSNADGDSGTGSLGQSGSGLEQRLLAQQDANFNTTALVSTGGAALERYVEEPYGTVTVLAGDWSSRPASQYQWIYLHQGGRYEPITLLYHFRRRDYSSNLGVWVQEDPIGYGDGMNVYQYVGGNPGGRVDPSGLLFSLVVNLAFAATDTFLYATGRISPEDYSDRMALNVMCIAIDAMTFGSGGGTVFRAGAVAVRAAQAGKAIRAGAALNAAVHAMAEAGGAAKDCGGGGGTAGNGGGDGATNKDTKDEPTKATKPKSIFDPGMWDPDAPINLTVDDLMKAGNKPAKNHLTAAGEALKSHAARRKAFKPPTTGQKASDWNEAGEKVLKDILENGKQDPKTPREWNRTGLPGDEIKIIDIYDPQGRGARFSADGKNFITFLEP